MGCPAAHDLESDFKLCQESFVVVHLCCMLWKYFVDGLFCCRRLNRIYRSNFDFLVLVLTVSGNECNLRSLFISYLFGLNMIPCVLRMIPACHLMYAPALNCETYPAKDDLETLAKSVRQV